MSATTELIRELIATGLTQTEIGRQTGIPQPRLSRWLAGDTPAGADDALRLHALRDSLRKPPLSPESVAVHG
jgi:transcriptional regulator with XRE-family HTH domain